MSCLEVESVSNGFASEYVDERRDLSKLEEMDCILLRHGGKHDWYHNPVTKSSQPVLLHREIKEYLAKHIIKNLD